MSTVVSLSPHQTRQQHELQQRSTYSRMVDECDHQASPKTQTEKCARLKAFALRWLPTPKDVVAGGVSFMLGISIVIILSGAIFQTERTKPFLGQLVSMYTLGIGVTGVIFTVISRIPYGCPGPDSFPLPFFLPMMATLEKHITDDHELLHTSLMMIAGSHVSIGLVLFGAGCFESLRVSDSVPYPVVCGLLAGLGVIATNIAVNLVLVDIHHTWLKLLLTTAFALAFIWTNSRPPVFFVLLLVVSISVFYSTWVGIAGLPIAEAANQGWMFVAEELTPDHFLVSFTLDFGAINWGALLHVAPTYIAMLLLYLLKTVLVFPGFEKVMHLKIDVPFEMRVFGGAVALCGALGAVPGIIAAGVVDLMYRISPRFWVPSLVTTVLYILTFSFSCASLLAFVPKFVYIGLLLANGLILLWTWAVQCRFKLPPSEHAVVIFIVVIALFSDVVTSVVVGLGLSVLLLAHDLHALGCVKLHSDARILRSRVDRTLADCDTLEEIGDCVQILQLQGYLFFGNAPKILDHVKIAKGLAAFTPKPEPSVNHRLPLFFILDLPFVLGMDASALDIMAQARADLETRCTLIFCGANARVRQNLERALQTWNSANTKVFVDLDKALEFCETALLETVRSRVDSSKENGGGFEGCLKKMGTRFSFDVEPLMLLKEYALPIDLNKGDVLMNMRAGTTVDRAKESLFFVESGLISVERDPAQSITIRRSQLLEASATVKSRIKNHSFRITKIGAGWVIGALEYCTGQRTIGIFIAESQSRVYRVSFDILHTLEQTHPQLISRLHLLFARIIGMSLEKEREALSCLVDMVHTSNNEMD